MYWSRPRVAEGRAAALGYNSYVADSNPGVACKEPSLLKGIVSKLTIKVWMCQKCGTMKDYSKKFTKHTGYNNDIRINLPISF
jgi:hypothetical protein